MVTYVDPKLCDHIPLVCDGKLIGEYYREPFGIWADTWTAHSFISNQYSNHIAKEQDARDYLIQMYQEHR
jgi:hypothetical protein